MAAAKVSGQVVSMTGPSNHSMAPPSSASSVSEVLAEGDHISLKIGSSSTGSDLDYKWYKQDSTGTKYLIQDGSNSTLTETASGAGYYIYQLLISNSNQCTSEISDPFKVYVLPPLNPTISASSSAVCANGTSTATLMANVSNTAFSYLYQWMLNGADISGATSATYTTSANATSNSSYAVKVSFAIKNTVNGTASQNVNIVAVPPKPGISIGQ